MVGLSQWGHGADVPWHLWICRGTKCWKTFTRVDSAPSFPPRLVLRQTGLEDPVFCSILLWHQCFMSTQTFSVTKRDYDCQVGFKPNVFQQAEEAERKHLAEGCFILIMSVKWRVAETQIWPLMNTNRKSWSSKLINSNAVKRAVCTGEPPLLICIQLGFANQLLFSLLICSNAIRHLDSSVCRRLIVCFVNSSWEMQPVETPGWYRF